jgi:hypothetical protein
VLTHLTTFFRVELSGIEIVLVHGRAEGVNVLGNGSRMFTNRHVVAVYKINELPFSISPIRE